MISFRLLTAFDPDAAGRAGVVIARISRGACEDVGMIGSARLLLLPMTVALIDALIAGDETGADAALDVRFPAPFRPPPETDDVLDVFRGQVAGGTDFPPYLIVRAADRAVIGSAGTSAPDHDGVVVLGYGVYPEHEGHGYARRRPRCAGPAGRPPSPAGPGHDPDWSHCLGEGRQQRWAVRHRLGGRGGRLEAAVLGVGQG